MKIHRVIDKNWIFLKERIPKTPGEMIRTGFRWKKKWADIQHRLQPLKTGRRVIQAVRLLADQLSQSMQKEGLSLKREIPVLQSRKPFVKRILKYMKVQ